MSDCTKTSTLTKVNEMSYNTDKSRLNIGISVKLKNYMAELQHVVWREMIYENNQYWKSEFLQFKGK